MDSIALVIIARLINSLRRVCEQFPDKRTGSNIRYGMADIAMSAFSVFFMQCASFLSHQPARFGNEPRSVELPNPVRH